MPNIIVSEKSGYFGQLYGALQAPIASFIETQAALSKANCLALKIFAEKNSDSYAEAYGGMNGADLMKPVGEGARSPLNGISMRDPKTLVNVTWKSHVDLTPEIVDDAHGNMKKIVERMGASKLTESYYDTIEAFLFGLLAAAASNKTKYQMENETFDTTCYDGKNVFSTSHDAGSNVFSDAFSKESLGELSTVQQNYKDDNKHALNLAPDTIIIPNTYKAKAKVFEVIGAEKDPGTANNGFNYLFGQWSVVTSPLLNHLASGDAFPYILLDSTFNEKNDGNVFQNRKDLTIKSKETEDDNNRWDASARFTGGFVDFRQMVLGGVSWGKTL